MSPPETSRRELLMNTAAAIGPEMAESGVFSFAELGRIAAVR